MFWKAVCFVLLRWLCLPLASQLNWRRNSPNQRGQPSSHFSVGFLMLWDHYIPSSSSRLVCVTPLCFLHVNVIIKIFFMWSNWLTYDRLWIRNTRGVRYVCKWSTCSRKLFEALATPVRGISSSRQESSSQVLTGPNHMISAAVWQCRNHHNSAFWPFPRLKYHSWCVGFVLSYTKSLIWLGPVSCQWPQLLICKSLAKCPWSHMLH